MELSKFKKVSNRARPDLMWQYVFKDANKKKYTITTMDSGKTFNLGIESLALNGRTYLSDLWKEGFSSPQEAIDYLKSTP